MKKLASGFIAGLILCSSAMANTLPAPLAKSLSELNLVQKPFIHNGDLQIAFNFDEIEQLQAKSAIESVCISYFGSDGNGKRAWKAGQFERVFITNDKVTQGFVYQDGDKSCDLWAKQKSDARDAFIIDRLSAANFKPQH